AAEESISLNLSIGGQLALGALSWQLTGWDRRVDNLITTAAIPLADIGAFPDGFTRTFINIPEEVRATGRELLLRGQHSDSLAFDVSCTYIKEAARGSRDQIPDRPRRQYKSSLSYASPTLPFGAIIAVKYIGRKSADVTGFGQQHYGD